MRQYSRPPIQSRSLLVFSEDKETSSYERLIPDWSAIVREDFPEIKVGKLWRFSLEEKEGIPIPKVKLFFLHRYVATDPNKEVLRLSEPTSNSLKLSLRRTSREIQSFDELFLLAKKWIPKWMEHFDVKSIKGVRLKYKNMLSKELTPFAFQDRFIKIDRWLTFMSRLPGKFNDVVGQFQTEINVRVDASKSAEFRYEVRSADKALDGTSSGIVVNFGIDTADESRNLRLHDCLAEIEWCHTILLEQFDAFFTEEAKRNFE